MSCVHACVLSHSSRVPFFATLWTVASQGPLTMGFSRHTGVGSYALLQGIFPIQGSNPQSLKSPGLAGGFFTSSATWEAPQE